MATKGKTWTERKNNAAAPRVKIIERPFAGIAAGRRMLISSPKEIEAFIVQIPKGARVCISDMRQKLAETHCADATCPVTTAIFLRIVAESALENYHSGAPADTIAPFWRVISRNGASAAKLSMDSNLIDAIRSASGDT
jgi:hypothetical protein